MKVKTYVELELEIDVDYTPSRPMPQCQDHDNPRYSDSGDDECVEITDIQVVISSHGTVLQRVKLPESLVPHVCDLITDDVADQCRDAMERKGPGVVDALDIVKDTIRSMHNIPKLAGYK